MKVTLFHRAIGILLILLAAALLFSIPGVTHAQRLFPTIVPNCDLNIGDDHIVPVAQRCNFNHLIQLFVNLFDWGLAILSILSVTFFLIGGAVLLTSAGNTDKVRAGMSILKNTLLGVVVALSSWLIVNTVIGILVGNGTFKDVKVFASNWWGVNSCTEEYNEVCSENALHQKCGDVETSYVSNLQRLLSQAGCGDLMADGCYGQITAGAVEKFQRANHLEVTGEVTREEWNLLRQGKTCVNAPDVDQLATGNGCCVPACGLGIENTEQQNGSNGCLDAYPSAYWYSDAGDPGSCNSASTTAVEGCCARIVDDLSLKPCGENVNPYWCRTYGPRDIDGVFHDGKNCSDTSIGCTSINNYCTE